MEDVIVEIKEDLYKSYKTYFNALSKFGYKKQTDVNKLIIYTVIEELLTGSMREFITEDDYRILERALHCLYGSSCLIPYSKYINNDSLYKKISFILPRISQDSILRHAENIRITL